MKHPQILDHVSDSGTHEGRVVNLRPGEAEVKFEDGARLWIPNDRLSLTQQGKDERLAKMVAAFIGEAIQREVEDDELVGAGAKVTTEYDRVYVKMPDGHDVFIHVNVEA